MNDVTKFINPMTLTELWFKEAVPQPTAKNLTVQLGVHLEEVTELIEALLPNLSPALVTKADDAIEALSKLAMSLKTAPVQDYVNADFRNNAEALDAVVDQAVTLIGIAYMSSWDIQNALNEVNRSNWSKFDENYKPVFNSDGKIMKGKLYTPPVLTPFLKK